VPMENETQSFDSTTSVVIAETILSTVSAADLALNTAFTFMTNDSRVPNATDETMWSSSDCGTFVADYGIVACVICGIAFIIGVIFCLFGKKLSVAQLQIIRIVCFVEEKSNIDNYMFRSAI